MKKNRLNLQIQYSIINKKKATYIFRAQKPLKHERAKAKGKNKTTLFFILSPLPFQKLRLMCIHFTAWNKFFEYSNLTASKIKVFTKYTIVL